MQYHLNGFNPGNPDISNPAATRQKSNTLHEKVDVLIAGCGPAGLCLAAQLSGFPEVSTMIVEPKFGPMEKGQADGINVRSMEMFQAFGFADKVKRESVWINETTFWTPDPNAPKNIHRAGRVQDVEDGLSEMPHVLLNQARVHDMYLDIMQNSPSQLEPSYGLKVVDVVHDAAETDHPVQVTLEHTDPDQAGQRSTLRARYVVGCDGARSRVRKAIGGVLQGDAAHQAWGVVDVLAVTDFPDARMKAIIQSKDDGNILFLPREGGYLTRLYVELDRLDADERVADRGLGIDDIIAKTKRILHPFAFDVKEVVWWSIYEVGHRLSTKFDDVPKGETGVPRIFVAGDACHTHSPKSGQGMNVSMGDTFNLGWKLISVLTGRSPATLLRSYSAERWSAAKALVDFDHKWARAVGAPAADTALTDAAMPPVQQKFIEGGRFTAGLTVQYDPSALIGGRVWQHLATGFEIGKRFHSAPVVRLADAMPMQLGHVIETGIRWTVFVFSPMETQAVQNLCEALDNDPQSPLKTYRRASEDIDALIDVRAIFQQSFRDLDLHKMPKLLRPSKGRHGLTDYEKIFCANPKDGNDIYSLRGIDRSKGCMVVVRPDQYVSQILPPDAYDELANLFAGVFQPVETAANETTPKTQRGSKS